MQTPATEPEFPLQEARQLVRDLLRPNAAIYWADFGFSITLGWASFVLAVMRPSGSWMQVALAVLTALALYRSVIFIHELAHLRRGTFGGFRLLWNLLCGFPLLAPSFTYRGVHTDHHMRDVYGTQEDGEYVPFAVQRPWKLVAYVAQALVLPLAMVGRFLLLTPLSYLIPPLRRWLWSRASSLTIDFAYRRPEATERDGSTWQVQEFMAFAYAAGTVTLVVLHVLPRRVLILWYAVTALVFVLNSLRTLAAHCYRNPGDKRMNIPEQFLDSVDVPGNRFFTTLWAPVGLRYHATHHLFPSMPYHQLGRAYRRLVAELSDNTLYLKATRRSLFDALRRIWREARLATAGTGSEASRKRHHADTV